MRRLAWVAALLLVPSTAWGAYERKDGIKVVRTHLEPGKPVNYSSAYEFSYGLSSFAGSWQAFAGGGRGDAASLAIFPGSGSADPGLRFVFALKPGGDLWALLNFHPGAFSPILIGPGNGFFFRARTTNAITIDEYPDRWYLQARVMEGEGRVVTYRTADFEMLDVWQTFYASSLDFGREGEAGFFAAGASRARILDLSFVPEASQVREGDLVLDAFMVYGPGAKVPGVDGDGDGLPDYADGDDDNDGLLDSAQAADRPLVVTRTGYVQGGGRWSGRFSIASRALAKGDVLAVDASLSFRSVEIARAIHAIPEVVGILVGERRHDREGRYHSFTNHMMSALLTPTGQPIENFQTLLPTRHVNPAGGGIQYSYPIDAVCRVPTTQVLKEEGGISVDFSFRVPVTAEIPEGHYWLFAEFGVVDGDGNFMRLDGLPFEAMKEGVGLGAQVVTQDEHMVWEKKNVLAMVKIGNPAPPRMPWALLFDQELQGVKGIVPEEEQGQWALNTRTRLPSLPIYPPGRYNLEPGFPSLANPSLSLTYPMNPKSGRVSVQVTTPRGETRDLGEAPFAAMTSWGATTRTGKFLFDFREYGEYRIRMKGWILDATGGRFEGGGTYRLWIAERITFGTFPSLPYEVGQTFLGSIEVVPPVPADVSLTVEFYPYSDPSRREVFTTKGKADTLGMFVSPETYAFKDPGEYRSTIDAAWTDPDGRLWKGSLQGAMVVAPKESDLSVHGRTGYMRNAAIYPTATRFFLFEEGRAENGVVHFLFYPHYSGDVMYIASTMDNHNYIFPLLTMEFPGGFVPYGGADGKRVLYNVFPTTSDGVSPFCFPERIDRIAYYYVDAWRPGVSGRHVIAASQVMSTWWSTSPSMMGRQMHTSPNGDLPGDIYRFTGGIVYKDLKTGKTSYGIYASMGVVTPRGEMRNRVVPPASEPLLRLKGRDYYLFLGGGVLPIPGVILLEGGATPSGGAANPPVPADLKTVVVSPSGKESTYRLKASAFGLFPRGRETSTRLDEPGVWRARQELSFGGRTGDVLGSADGSYKFYVLPRDEGQRFALALDLPPVSKIGPGQSVVLSGALPEDVQEGVLHFTTVSPGLILEEGECPMSGGRFRYVFDPWATGKRIPFYDTVDFQTGRPCLCDTVVFNLFFAGRRKDGTAVYGARVAAMRGDTVIAVPPPAAGGK